MDLVLNVADYYVLTPYVYPASWPEDGALRQIISLLVLTNLGAAVLYLGLGAISYYLIFDHNLKKHPHFLEVYSLYLILWSLRWYCQTWSNWLNSDTMRGGEMYWHARRMKCYLVIQWIRPFIKHHCAPHHIHFCLLLFRIRFKERSNMRWPLFPGSAFPQWHCFSLKSEDTANCMTALTIPHSVSWRTSSPAFSCSIIFLFPWSSWSWCGLCAFRLAWALPEYDLLPAFHWHVYLLDSSLLTS